MIGKPNYIPEQIRQQVLKKAAASCSPENVEQRAGDIVVQALVASQMKAAQVSRNAVKQLLVDAIRAARCNQESASTSGDRSRCHGRSCLAV